MSMYFDLGDETLWNPSNGAGRLFMRQVEVFEAELGLPSGIGQGRYWRDPDVLEVDPVAYAEFVRGLVVWHRETRHSVILTLSEGFAATAVALARRAGIEVEMPAAGAGDVWGGVRRDVQVPGDVRASSAAVVDALDTRAREVDRWMAR
ncbi:DUF6086 family protein [Streptomyces sp. NRRL S-37]|uniref:DUF6086 family protein n=1 Tax=Streptomyces sp. NRRL S-37 TaxID=1463903 RepID=UPI0006902BC7|nr:DUF6086 family protein [Streptomyces sp. NRRL S-37]